jgi:hypothetical protein
MTTVIKGRTDNAIKNHWNSSMKKKVADLMIKYQSIKKRGGLSCEEVLKENPSELIQELLKKCIALGDKDYHSLHGVHGTSLRKYRKRKKFQKQPVQQKMMKITLKARN